MRCPFCDTHPLLYDGIWKYGVCCHVKFSCLLCGNLIFYPNMKVISAPIGRGRYKEKKIDETMIDFLEKRCSKEHFWYIRRCLSYNFPAFYITR